MKNLPLFILAIILSSCASKLDTAKESLVGEWKVEQIFLNEIFSDGNFNSIDDQNATGMFVFTEETVDYSYELESETLSNEYDYTFEASKENAGFIKIDRFDVTGEENYRVRFGDQTSDSYKNATTMSLESVILSDSVRSTTLLVLEKI